MEFIQDCKNLPTKSYDRLGCIGIFGALGGALIDYGFQVATNYIKVKKNRGQILIGVLLLHQQL